MGQPMSQARDDTIEAAELERELRDEYVTELPDEPDTATFDDASVFADRSDK